MPVRAPTRTSAELTEGAGTRGEKLGPIIEGSDDPGTCRRPRFALTAGQEFDPDCRLRVVVFGTVAAGKTSLVNALIRRSEGHAIVVESTAHAVGLENWEIRGPEGYLLLTDTPGISGVGQVGALGEAEAIELAIGADLVLVVLDHDLIRAELDALSTLLERGKRAVVVLNKKDRLAEPDLKAILIRLRERLTGLISPDDVVAVAAKPRPALVRVRKLDGSEETLFEYEDPDLIRLEERIEAILSLEASTLRAGNLLLRAYLLRKAEEERSRRERRVRAEGIVDRYQWMAAAAAVAIPLPTLDLMATGAVEYQMVSEIAAIYGADLSAAHVRMISQQMIQTLMKRKVVESATALVAGALKSSMIGYAAGGLIQAVTIAYLTRITGRTFLDYFEQGQDWGESGMQGVLSRQLELIGRSDFLREFFHQYFVKLRRWISRPR